MTASEVGVLGTNRHGFAPNKRTQESDELGVYVNIVNKVTMDMGISGDRSGGVMRPGGEVIALRANADR